MQVGDLIKEKGYPEVGLLLEIKDRRHCEPYGILCPSGKVEWFTKTYLEEKCEIVSANR